MLDRLELEEDAKLGIAKVSIIGLLSELFLFGVNVAF